ncbi:MAG TPA: hypothetical protein VKA00_03625 [Trueperaceae bacterium]|nr:hypothetical protein [Trueperaceae bacterium]
MLKLESVALELLEYKVAEYRATRKVRGGLSGMWELFAHLNRQTGVLSQEERSRLEAISDSLQVLSDGEQQRSKPAALDIDSLVLGEDLASVELIDEEPAGVDEAPSPAQRPEVREEQAVLRRLAQRVWWDEVEEYVLKVAAGWRAERERQTARLIYATLQNMQRNSGRSTFDQDVNLRGFQVREPIPQVNDPLVSLSDLDSLAEIVRELINVVMTLGKSGGAYPDLEVRESGALAFVRQAAQAVAEDPYAGKLSLVAHQGPSSKQLRLAIQEIGKERLPDGQRSAHRRELENRLAETLALERNQRQLFQRDVLQFSDLVHAFFERLADYLPTAVGGRASGPQLEGGVLFAVNPALRWERVPPGTKALTVHLVGPVRFDLEGHSVAVMGAGPSRSLFVDEREVPLEGRVVLELGHSRLMVFTESNYVHFRYRDEGRSLAVLLSEALVVLYVLADRQREDILSTLRVLTNSVQGEPQDLAARAVARASAVSARAPDRRRAVDGLLRGASRAAGVTLEENTVLGLVQRFLDTMTADPTDVAKVLESVPGAETGVRQLTGEPLTVDVAGVKLTVRQYRGRSPDAPESLVAMLPGQVLGSFSDYLLAPLGSGTLVLVRGEQGLAVLHAPGTDVGGGHAH